MRWVKGYLAAAAMASLFYIAWLAVFILLTPAGIARGGAPPDLSFAFGFAVFFWLFEGAAAALAWVVLPWPFVVMGYRRLKLSGPSVFVLSGAMLLLAAGSSMAALAPKPLFVEDQTFLEGFAIAMERQGVCFLLMGAIFGLVFWYVSARTRTPN